MHTSCSAATWLLGVGTSAWTAVVLHDPDKVCHAVCAVQLTKWFTWFVLVAFITTAVFWVTRLNKVSWLCSCIQAHPRSIAVPAAST